MDPVEIFLTKFHEKKIEIGTPWVYTYDWVYP